MNLLFVCTGNTCRSPMAEGLMRKLVEREGLKVEVQSAGVAAYAGTPASVHTSTILRARGIESQHASQPVTSELVSWADLILTMTMSHKQVVAGQFPEAQGKLYTLKEYIGGLGDMDIMDPFGGSLDVYRRTETELDAALEKLKDKIDKM
ncbi:low molecular weight protein arginine phosphatase [Ammoniphilus sp. CFH 90114]|uniref:low molecular weight protein arginine phosphatase n=1 Tax=Ammoniphilus sp. CFH 90114 TaxID=2493665 RepID=UPI00100F27D8|nr:low molecular weight protein arginine phosphatase [Ammoniphilus sp. CFH 90114]RXT08686.1 low molecular weight protein arginine phosphatase [Ammoniphilus sp. CFH 90114]